MRRAHQTAHARIWLALAVLLPAILLLGHVTRGVSPESSVATRLEAPR